MISKREVIQGDKKIIYEIHMENDKYKGMNIDILDLNKPILESKYLSINPALYVHTIETNFDPNANSHLLGEDILYLPAECYVVDEDILQGGLTNRFKGDYLGNIIINTPNGKKVVCFVSQNGDRIQRYYKFLDLTFGNILACTEWDLDWEYLGMPSDKEEHDEYLRALYAMEAEMDFTTQISTNGEEKLIDYNSEGVTEEGSKKYDIFRKNIMDVLDKGYNLLKMQEKAKIEEQDNCLSEIGE